MSLNAGVTLFPVSKYKRIYLLSVYLFIWICFVVLQTPQYGRLSKKYSSCSTIFIDDSTVSQPNLKNTIKAVALAIFFHIKNRDLNGGVDMIDSKYMDIFDEKLHPLSVS